MNAPVRLAHDWFDGTLPANVDVGPGSWIHSSYGFLHYRSALPCGVRIGAHTGIYAGTWFDLGPAGSLAIGDYCTIVGAIFSCNSPVRIGDYALISHEVIFADDPFAGPEGTSPPGVEASIVLGCNVWVGARSLLLKGANVGDHAIVAAGALVDFAVPPYAIVAGHPARVVGDVREDRARS